MTGLWSECDGEALLDHLGHSDRGWRDAYLRAVVADLEGGAMNDLMADAVGRLVEHIADLSVDFDEANFEDWLDGLEAIADLLVGHANDCDKWYMAGYNGGS